MLLRSKKKKLKLTKEQKKLIWAKTEENAGAGWQSHGQPRDPVKELRDA